MNCEEQRSGAVLYAKDLERLAAFYVAILDVQPTNRDTDHVVLEARGFELVVLQIPKDVAATITIAVPPVRRAQAAVKLVFFVPSIARVRALTEASGGVMNASTQEWSFNGFTVCDGLDPEGNVIQFRERAS